MTLLARSNNRHYPPSAYSGGVGDDSIWLREHNGRIEQDSSITLGHQQSALFQRIIEVRSLAEHENWDDDEAHAISPDTVKAAIQLLHALPPMLPPPEINPEITGEISFEWYKDTSHVAVLTVDGEFIRWAAMIGADSPTSGAEPFTKTVPAMALEVIQAVI